MLFSFFLGAVVELSAKSVVVTEITPTLISVSPSKKQLQSMNWPNDVVNSYAIKTSSGIVLIDTQDSPANAQLIKDAVIDYFADSVFVYVINTHGHSAHSGGNCVFPQDHIVAQVNSIDEIKNYDDIFLGQTVEFLRKKIMYNSNVLDTITAEGELSDSINESINKYRSYEYDLMDNYKPRYPDITFTDRKTLTSGEHTFQLTYMGKGHGNADITVYVPQEKALLTGNLFHLGSFGVPQMPNFYLQRENEIDKWITSLTEVLDPKNEIEYVLTTHGESPLSRLDMEFVLEYCKAVRSAVKIAKQRNTTIEDVKNIDSVKSVFDRYSSNISINKTVKEMHARNVQIIWKFIE